MSPTSSFVGVFDLNSQNGVMSVLASIRASNISAADKNELRDLVFLYTNGGGDTSVKLALEQKLAAHQIQVVSVKKSQSGPALAFGSYRPTPTFRTPVASAPASTPLPVAPVPVTPAPVVAPQNPPQPQAVPAPIVPAAPVPVQPAQVASVPVVAVAVPVVPPVPMPAASVPVAPAPVTTPSQPQSVPEDRYLERIRQIKTAVNSKVGNPVNLVDINNAVGREYMNALLEAMKKLSSGAVSEMEPAMARLENSFVQVEIAIQNHKASTNATQPAPVSVPNSVPVPAPVVAQIPVTSAPAQPPITPNVSVPTPTPVLPKAVVPPSPVVPPLAPLPVRAVEPVKTEVPVVNNAENEFTVAPAALKIADTATSGGSASPIPITDVPPSAPIILAAANVPVVEEKSGFEDSSLANNGQKVLTPKDLPDPASLATSVNGDPLFTAEIDSGLEQLLADWTLFKKSGLFGTGPHGREHPLFKKIADLQVPLLLAGRFEGATQDIRQSVTDYMNGWRYEQGIIYSPGETFEKYLRRVIKHILDLQKVRK